MSENEPTNPGVGPEFKLIMPSLPTLYEGVFEEVYADYIADPDGFKTSSMYRLRGDNPALFPFFATEVLFDDRDISVKWPWIYYEMFARSSRRDGLPPIQISDQIVTAAIGLFSFELDTAFESDRVREEVLERLKTKSEERKRRDRDLSPELVKFWNTVEQDMQMQLEDGAVEEQLELYLTNLRKLQEILQRQHDEYALTAHYLSQP